MINKSQTIKQRVGKLIENYVCKRRGLAFNKRQQTKGFFDAYNGDNIFEIKGVKTTQKESNPRITLYKRNHELLKAGNGKYIIVNYILINKDLDLQFINDIKVIKEIEISAYQMDVFISLYGTPYERTFKGHKREYIRIKLNDIMEDKQ